MTGGKPLTTARFRALNKKYAIMLGWNSKEVSAHTPRIEGAAEYVASVRRSLRAEARAAPAGARPMWSSDVVHTCMYARMTRRAHLAASDHMFQAKGRDLEEIIPEFVEPAGAAPPAGQGGWASSRIASAPRARYRMCM